MIRQTIYALSGFPGGIFKVKENGHGIEICGDVSQLHPSEVSLLKYFAHFGGMYYYIKRLIDKYSKFSISSKNQTPELYLEGGYYEQLMYMAISDFLETYLDDLVTTEKEVIKSPSISLTLLKCKFEKYHCVMKFLYDFVCNLELTERFKSKKILDFFYHGCVNADHYCMQVSKGVFKRVMRNFYHKIEVLMLEGQLNDRYDEFFIKVKAIDHDNDCITQGSSVNFPQTFTICEELVPSFITSEFAEKILNLGKDMSVLKLCLKSNVVEEQLQWFWEKLCKLSSSEFTSLHPLEELLNELRTFLVKKFWANLLSKSEITQNMEIMHRIFLFSDPDLYQDFMAKLDHHLGSLNKPQTNNKLIFDINSIFRAILTQMNLNEHPVISKMEWRWEKRYETEDSIVKPSIENIFDLICVVFPTTWPFKSIFTPENMTRYQNIFRLLMKMNVVRWRLADLGVAMTTPQVQSLLEEEGVALKSISLLRWNVQHTVNCLYNHFQCSIINQLFHRFIDVSSQEDIQLSDLIHSHQNFLSSVESGLLMKSSMILEHMKMLFKETLFLYNKCTTENKIKLSIFDISQIVDRRLGLLAKMICSRQENCDGESDVSVFTQLVLALDFNRYTSSSVMG